MGFIKNGTEVRIASLAGAPTVTLTDKANSSSGDWGDDGYVYFEVDSGVGRMRATGGEIEPVYRIQTKAREVATEWVHVLPGAHGILFRLRHLGQGPGDFEIMVMPLPRGPARSLVRGVYATYSPTGHLLVVTADGKLIGIPFDAKKLQLTGAPIALIEGIGVRNGGFNIDLALAGNGTLAYTTGGTLGSRRAAWVSREGLVTPVDSGVGSAGRHRLGEPVARREAVGGHADARRTPGHLGQAAPRGAVLADHLLRHLEWPPRLVGRRARRAVHHGPLGHRGRPGLRPPRGRHRLSPVVELPWISDRSPRHATADG